jgi:hypothetical protein
MACQVNDGVVVRNQPNVFLTKNVMAGAAGKIIGGKKPADMCAQVTAAASNKDFHKPRPTTNIQCSKSNLYTEADFPYIISHLSYCHLRTTWIHTAPSEGK